jgi:SWI/SNF-related matrix-associated actin-dependent regulator 1 of chromatin subfamily A
MKIHWDEAMGVFRAELDGSPFGTQAQKDAYWGGKDVVKVAGFRFDGDGRNTGIPKSWYTKFIEPVEKLRQYCVGEAAEKVGVVEEKREASRTIDADIEIPAPEGQEYMPFQRGGISYMSEQDNTLLGDDMGLGKTIQILGLVNLKPEIKNVLVIVPATVRPNWEIEAKKWLVRSFQIQRINKNVEIAITDGGNNIVVVGWSNLAQKKVRESLLKIEWDLVAADEAHYGKNAKAKRSQVLFGKHEYVKGQGDVLKAEGLVHHTKRTVFATGTPIVNRPIELFNMLRVLDPEGLGKNFFGYAKRYCDAKNNGYGWDFSGAKNLDELQNRLRATCMIRRMKTEVLKELPAKRRQVVTLDPNGSSRLIKKEQKLLDNIPGYREAVEAGDYEAAIKALQADSAAFEEMAGIRREIGEAKADKVVDFAKDSLENVKKIIVFAHHRDVQDRIAAELSEYGVVQVQGGFSDEKKQAAKEAFQGDDNVRVFVGSLEACREGLTLTAATTVIFAELPWTPSAVSQAEDRAHRIGQDSAVNVYHLVLEDSLDAYMAKTIVEKQNNIDAALDKRPEAVKQLVAPVLKAEPQEADKETEEMDLAVTVTEEDLEAPPF